VRAGYPSRPATKAYLDHELCITLRRNRPPMLLAFRGQLLQCMEKTLGDHISTTLERHTMAVFPVQAFHHGETSIRWRCFFCCSVLASLRLNFRIAVCDLHQSNDDDPRGGGGCPVVLLCTYSVVRTVLVMGISRLARHVEVVGRHGF